MSLEDEKEGIGAQVRRVEDMQGGRSLLLPVTWRAAVSAPRARAGAVVTGRPAGEKLRSCATWFPVRIRYGVRG